MSAGSPPQAHGGASLALAFRFAARELRGGLSGFRIFLACIALGVASIAAVNSVGEMMSEGIGAEGRAILGGDVRFALTQREASEEEARFLATEGTVSRSATLRSMARRLDGDAETLAEVKAVDGLYPLAGTVESEPAAPLAALLAERNGRFGALAPQELFDRLGLAVGDAVRLGSSEVELRAVLTREPDFLSDGFVFGPRLLVSTAALERSALVQLGSLVTQTYRVALDTPGVANAAAVAERAAERFPDAGWSVRTSERAAPSLQRSIERFAQFLTLVGLTALVVGGVGVANAVGAFLDSKREVIATLKSLGAPGRFVVTVYLAQIMALAFLGVAFGLGLGALAPFAAAGFIGEIIPVAAAPRLYPGALLLAALFGLLTALAFALLPLGRTRDVAATALFRQGGAGPHGRPRLAYLAAVAVLALLVCALALAVAEDRLVALVFLVAIAGSFVVLRLVATAVRTVAKAAPRVRSTPLRLAIGNIHRPGALTHSVTLSLGLGLTLLVAVASIDGQLRREIGETLAARAPDFFFVDIQSTEIDAFRDEVATLAPGGSLEAVPMLRGRVTALDGTPVREAVIDPRGAWVLQGDRGLTYSDALPENSQITEGEWWPAGYGGEPLVSFAAEEAGELGLAVGDTVTVNVLGRDITARIANLRVLEWESLAINFVMVFSPNAMEGAPHGWLATLRLADGASEGERAVPAGLADRFPAVTTVRVRDALDAVNALVAQLAVAIRAAAAVALVASVLVLSGALAAGTRGRVHDAVVLKTLGATRRTLITAFATEYALLGLATALFAVAAGVAASWYVVARIMELPFRFDPALAFATAAVALVLTIGFGLLGTWRVLGQKAAPVLREL